jgi:hypothetical protein
LDLRQFGADDLVNEDLAKVSPEAKDQDVASTLAGADR